MPVIVIFIVCGGGNLGDSYANVGPDAYAAINISELSTEVVYDTVSEG